MATDYFRRRGPDDFWASGEGHAGAAPTLYVLGVLQEADRVAFEGHLLGCADCLAECDRLGPLVTSLSHLTEREARSTAQAGRRAGVGTRAAARAARSSRPRWSPRRLAWTRPQLAVLAAAVAVAVGLGAAVGFVTGRANPAGPTEISLVAVADGGTANSPSVSVFVLNRRSGITVHATVVRLEPGVRYRLLAVTADGQTMVVTEWWGATEAQDVYGDLEVEASALAFFSVVRSDGTQVMLARVAR